MTTAFVFPVRRGERRQWFMVIPGAMVAGPFLTQDEAVAAGKAWAGRVLLNEKDVTGWD